MIAETTKWIARISSIAIPIILGTQFEYFYAVTKSQKILLSQSIKLIVGLLLVYTFYDIIEEAPTAFQKPVMFGIGLNAMWIVNYFSEKFKNKTKEKIDDKLGTRKDNYDNYGDE